MRKIVLFLLIAVQSAFLYSTTYYIATDGDDSNSGDINHPFASMQKAQGMVIAGDTVYIRGGNYILQESDISEVYQSLFACISFLDKSGISGKMINYWAYPGETPVFDFSAVKPVGQRVVGIYVKANYIHIKGIEMTGIQVTITTHTESYCIYSFGSHNIFENISMHDNVGTGLRHRDGGYNLFLNCDAYRNHDNVSENKLGGNTDGFGCHPKSTGVGNVFKGCRAWFNSDDGYDCIRANAAIVFDSCWAFYNGYSPSFASLGDGNGFKAGGYAYDTITKLPNPVPSNTIRHCITVNNKANGFYSNHHLAGNSWFNNSAYRNKVNYNMVNRESPESDNINVPGYDHILKNNLGYKARSKETDYIDLALCTLENNTFNSSISLTNDDFESLDEAWLTIEREADGSLPGIDFLRPVETSSLIDGGVDVGLSFYGDFPDIGAIEFYVVDTVSDTTHTDTTTTDTTTTDTTGTGTSSSVFQSVQEFEIYPNPVNDVLFIDLEDVNSVEVIDFTGKEISLNLKGQALDVSGLKSGVYILSVQKGELQLPPQRFIKLE